MLYLGAYPFIEKEDVKEVRKLRPIGKSSKKAKGLKKAPNLHTSIIQRSQAIAWAVQKTIESNQETVDEVVEIFSKWMKKREIVRVIGAGRALIAASLPANRLAHGGAKISIVGGLVPLPNTASGGAILAASASGKTPFVLQILQAAKKNNPKIERIGIADKSALKFKNLCHKFIGLDISLAKQMSSLFALADLGEYAISELLDALVVAAGDKIGIKEEQWKGGHEDLGPTGPYSPRA